MKDRKAFKLLISLIAISVTTVSYAESKAPAQNLMMSNAWQVLLSLGLILGLIFLLAFVYKRTSLGQKKVGGTIKILSSLPIGVKEKVVLVEVGDTQILVGATNQSINTLHVLSPDEKIADTEVSEAPFAKKLKEVMGKG